MWIKLKERMINLDNIIQIAAGDEGPQILFRFSDLTKEGDGVIIHTFDSIEMRDEAFKKIKDRLRLSKFILEIF